MKTRYFEIQQLVIGTEEYPLDTNNINNVKIYSSLDNPSLIVEIIYKDFLDIKNKIPLRGGEDIKITISDNFENTFEKTFTLIKIQEERVDSRGTTTMLYFKGVSKDSFLISIDPVSKFWEQTTISDMVSELDEDCEVSSTDGGFDIFIPNWTKAKAIQYLSGKAYSEKYGGNYFYFERMDGTFFRSLEELVDVEGEPDVYRYDTTNKEYKFNILEFLEQKTFDTLNSGKERVYQNGKEAFSYVGKEAVKFEKTYSEVFDSYTTLGDAKSVNPEIEELFSGYKEASVFHDEVLLEKETENKIRLRMFDKKMDILVNGSLDKNVGDVIDFEIPDKMNPAELNKNINGRYLVYKMVHVFGKDEYVCKMEIVKDSFYKE